jgi:carbon-monoxide dehydrogenase medium subunit
MLLNLREYHRPAAEEGRRGLVRALELLARSGLRTVPLAGGDTLLASADPAIDAMVDLQGLGLDTMAEEVGPSGPRLRIGAMVTRAALAAVGAGFAPAHGDRTSQVIVEGARRWGGSVQRNRATVGGAVATAAGNDPLVAALLACDATVVLFGQTGAPELALADFLPRRVAVLAAPALITGLIVPLPTDRTGAALEAVARTPADAPIVLAAAALEMADGACIQARLALGGVADIPLRLPEIETLLTGQTLTPDLIASAATRAAELVHPTGDFRGSAEYRRAMVRVLSRRALRTAWAQVSDKVTR